jgi:uncharacterized RDD family membrane protein YckC
MVEGVQAEAGWYPDPENPGQQRYWDGAAWGPASAASPGPPPPPAGYAYAQSPTAAVPSGMYFDPASGLLLPNGVQLASIGRRIGAWFLAIPLAIVTLGIGYVIWGLIVWGRGQTPALQVLGMRCWRPQTNRVATWGWMALREIVGRLVEGILSIITLLASFILMCAGKERKTIHDHIAGTVVLHDPNHVLVN